MTTTLSDGAIGACQRPGATDVPARRVRRGSAGLLGDFPEFDPSGSFAALRRREYGRLDADDQLYLDYTGGGLHAASQIDAHAELLRSSVLGNPHSNNPTSLAATALVERTRELVL